jgi:hypothetical protein
MRKNNSIDLKSAGLAKGSKAHDILELREAQFSSVFVGRLLGDRRRLTGSLVGLNFGRF